MSLQQRIVRTVLFPLALVLAGGVVAAMIVADSQQAIREHVRVYVEREELVSRIFAAMGYGGGIHSFKNYALRAEPSYLLRAESHFEAAVDAIEYYRSLADVTAEEREYLATIRDTVREYLAMLPVAEQMVAAQRDTSEIDRAIRIDDGPALSAIEELQNYLQRRGERELGRLDAASARALATAGAIVLGAMLFAVLLSLGLARKTLAAVRRLVDISDSIAAGERRIEQTRLDGMQEGELKALGSQLIEVAGALETTFADLEAAAQRDSVLKSLSMLFSQTADLREVSAEVLRFLAPHACAAAGKLYVNRGTGFELAGSWGLRADDEVEIQHQRLLRDMQTAASATQIESIPADFWALSSSFGDTAPGSLVFVPVSYLSEPLGILEFAGFEECPSEKVAALERFGEVLGIGLNATLIQAQNATLLHDSQVLTTELEMQQEELRSSNEGLAQRSRELERQKSEIDATNRDLEQARRDLEDRAQALMRTNRYKSEFLANMSHELRTPLNSLMVLSSLLAENRERNLSDKQLEFAQSIYQAGNDLLVLIDEILDLAKIEARKILLRPESFTLGRMLDELDRTYQPLFAEKDVEWRIEVDESLRIVELQTDKQRLKQILRNLISNALKFTAEGYVELRVEAMGEDKLRYSVRDTGIGVAEDKLARIFEAFEQADGSVERSYGGTGLGLTISSQLAYLLGGSIEVESAPGIGSTFTVAIDRVWSPAVETSADVAVHSSAFPAAESARSESSALSEAATHAGAMLQAAVPASAGRPASEKRPATADGDVLESDGEQDGAAAIALSAKIASLDPDERTILIVEDDERFAETTAEVVDKAGFVPVIAGDGAHALNAMTTFTPSAVLLDHPERRDRGRALRQRQDGAFADGARALRQHHPGPAIAGHLGHLVSAGDQPARHLAAADRDLHRQGPRSRGGGAAAALLGQRHSQGRALARASARRDQSVSAPRGERAARGPSADAGARPRGLARVRGPQGAAGRRRRAQRLRADRGARDPRARGGDRQERPRGARAARRERRHRPRAHRYHDARDERLRPHPPHSHAGFLAQRAADRRAHRQGAHRGPRGRARERCQRLPGQARQPDQLVVRVARMVARRQLLSGQSATPPFSSIWTGKSCPCCRPTSASKSGPPAAATARS
nr:ATP-binding protein [Haliangium ochraceum]